MNDDCYVQFLNIALNAKLMGVMVRLITWEALGGIMRITELRKLAGSRESFRSLTKKLDSKRIQYREFIHAHNVKRLRRKVKAYGLISVRFNTISTDLIIHSGNGCVIGYVTIFH